MIAALDAIQMALTYTNITKAWNATHLFPLREEPPHNNNRDQTFLDQLEEDSVLKTSRTEKKRT